MIWGSPETLGAAGFSGLTGAPAGTHLPSTQTSDPGGKGLKMVGSSPSLGFLGMQKPPRQVSVPGGDCGLDGLAGPAPFGPLAPPPPVPRPPPPVPPPRLPPAS